MRETKVYIKILINLLFIILVAIFSLLILPKILRFFMPFVIGWIIAMIANPLVKFLENKVKILRKHSSAIIIIIVIGAIVGLAYLLISILAKEAIGFIDEIPEILEHVGLQFSELSERLELVSTTLPGDLQEIINKMLLGVSNYFSDIVDDVELSLNTAGTFAKNVAEVFLMIIVTILSAYFFIARRDELVDGLQKNMPSFIIDGWHLIFYNFKKAVGGYFKAQFKIMLVLTVIMFIAFEILTVNYSFLLALGISFLDLLPVFGTGAVLWPWAVISMISGNYMRAVGLIVIYLICQIVKQVLQPKMVGDSIGISPLATLVFMFTGYRIYGVIGMIFGIPIGMVMVTLYRVGMFDRIIRGFKIIVHDINEFRKF